MKVKTPERRKAEGAPRRSGDAIESCAYDCDAVESICRERGWATESGVAWVDAKGKLRFTRGESAKKCTTPLFPVVFFMAGSDYQVAHREVAEWEFSKRFTSNPSGTPEGESYFECLKAERDEIAAVCLFLERVGPGEALKVRCAHEKPANGKKSEKEVKKEAKEARNLSHARGTGELFRKALTASTVLADAMAGCEESARRFATPVGTTALERLGLFGSFFIALNRMARAAVSYGEAKVRAHAALQNQDLIALALHRKIGKSPTWKFDLVCEVVAELRRERKPHIGPREVMDKLDGRKNPKTGEKIKGKNRDDLLWGDGTTAKNRAISALLFRVKKRMHV